MKKVKTLTISLLTVALMVSCFPKASQLIRSLPVENKTQILSQYTNDQIAKGETLMQANCGNCHKIKAAETRTAEQWNGILKRMIPKAKLSDDDGLLVRAYLIAHSKEI